MKHRIASPLGPIPTLLALAFATGAAHAWTVSGTVRNSTGTALEGVSVSVKDSSGYSTTTNSAGAFSLQSGAASVMVPGSSRPLAVSASGRVLAIRSPQDGFLDVSLFDGSGRFLWSARPVATRGEASVTLPLGLRSASVLLRIRQGASEFVQALTLGADGGARVAPFVGIQAARALESFPVLVFRKSGYRDTTYAMASASASGIAIAMADTGSDKVCQLPSSMKWKSSGILVSPKPDSKHSTVYSVKDPTIQYYNGNWIVYATVNNGGWTFEFMKFSDFDKAAAATPTYMDQISGFGGYKCAPELFYMAPQKKWYILSQGGPWYSTTTTPDIPTSWSAPKTLFNMPSGQANIDFYPICDSKYCHLFFTGDDGYLYKTSTTVENFPSGWNSKVDTVLRYPKNKTVLFEGSSHYKLKGLNKYLTLIEGFGTKGRAFSAWIADTLGGPWKELMVGPNNFFAASQNVTYETGVADWTDDVSHGELLRDNPDQTQTVDPCNLRLFYQGRDPKSTVDYGQLPYRLGLLKAY